MLTEADIGKVYVQREGMFAATELPGLKEAWLGDLWFDGEKVMLYLGMEEAPNNLTYMKMMVDGQIFYIYKICCSRIEEYDVGC